jgi:hypothetical protein
MKLFFPKRTKKKRFNHQSECTNENTDQIGRSDNGGKPSFFIK